MRSLDSSVRYGPARRPSHLRVERPLYELVQCASAASYEQCGEQRVKHQQDSESARATRRSQIESCEGCNENKETHFLLDQLPILGRCRKERGRPALLRPARSVQGGNRRLC